jgi:hypothetical protein
MSYQETEFNFDRNNFMLYSHFIKLHNVSIN